MRVDGLWRVARKLVLAALVLAVVPFAAVAPRAHAAPSTAPLCFSETGQCIDGRIRQYWEGNGGLPVFGYPITPQREEFNHELQRTFQTQWFERNRFELHPENAAPYDVLLGRLGADGLRKAGIDYTKLPTAPGPQSGCLWFPETRHNVCDQTPGRGFRAYWESHGLEFGDGGNSFRESLALFGFPISEPRVETNSSGDTVLTQWFERARFEWHPGNPDAFKVLLGRLGAETIAPLVRTANPGLAGRLIVKVETGLYSLRADGSQANTLQTNLSTVPLLSRDGKRLAGVNWCSQSGLCVAQLDGSARQILVSDAGAAVSAWSPDGSKILYTTASEGRRGLYVIDVNTRAEAQLFAGTSGLMPAGGEFSPDGRRVLFNTTFSEQALYVVNVDGSGLRKIADRGTRGSWAPDGTRIVYVSDRAGSDDLYLTNGLGATDVRLTNDPGLELAPSWSPDGSLIAYLHVRADRPVPAAPAPTAVRVIAPDGTGGRAVITSEPVGFAYMLTHYQWSPDGATLAGHLTCARLCGPDLVLAAGARQGSVVELLRAERAGIPINLLRWLPLP